MQMSGASGKTDSWLVGMNAKGDIAWQKTLPSGGMPFDVSGGDGGFLLTGSTESPDKGAAFLAIVDPAGSMVWSQVHKKAAGAKVTWFTRGRPVNGGWLVVGEKDSPKTGQGTPWLMRVGAFGHKTCAEAGTCAAKSMTSCADNNPCTLDTCDGNSGCKHSNAPDGAVCGVGKKCTTGVCK